MTMTIYANGRILLDGKATGYGVRQDRYMTHVYRLDGGPRLNLPRLVYSLAANKPGSGNPGREDFERDLRAALGAKRP